MGTCFSKPTEIETTSPDARALTLQQPSSTQHQRVANPGRESTQVIDVPSYGRRSTRDRTQSTPYRVRPMNNVEFPPLPRQRTRAKSSVASPSNSSRSPNPDVRHTSAGECEHDRSRGPSLTVTRALKSCSRANCNGFSAPPAARLSNAGIDSQRLEVRSSTTVSCFITHVYNPCFFHRFRLLVVGKVRPATPWGACAY